MPAGAILAGGLLTSAYTVRVLTHAFKRVPEPAMPNPIPPVMEWTAFALAAMAVGLGLLAWWPVELLHIGAPVGGPILAGGAVP